jgi:hypothetical protein
VVALALVGLSLAFGFAPESRGQEIPFSRAADEAAARLAEAFPPIQGSLIGVEGERVLIDLGAKQNVPRGMELEVYREGEELRHPVTGVVLGRRDKRLALVRVEEVKEAFSEGILVSRHGGARIAVGDRVRNGPDRLSVALPLIEAGEVKGADVSSATKDLAIALAKTGRFIVIEQNLIRAALTGEKSWRFESLTDPAVLKALAQKTGAELLVLGKLSPGDRGALLNMQVVSVSTGASVGVASVELTGARSVATPVASAGPEPLAKGRPAWVQPLQVGPSKPGEPVRRPVREGARQEGPAGEAPGKGAVPSFLVKVDQGGARFGDQGARDHLIFEVADPLVAIAAGDLDGDGHAEIVGMTDSEVIVYRRDGHRLVPIARSGERERFVRYLHLDVGDVNGSGRAQVFVTALSGVPEGLKVRNSLHSFVLELREGKLVRIAEDLDHFLRVLTGPGIDPPLLIAQRLGAHMPFAGPIFRLRWSGERYLEAGPLVLRAPVKGLYDFAPLSAADGQVVEAVAITEKGRVRSYSSRGEALWESKEELGEVDHLVFFQTPGVPNFHAGLRAGPPANPEEVAERIVLPRRVLVKSPPLWGDALVEVLTLANAAKYGLLIAASGESAGGRIVAFDRRDGSFTRGWETVPVEGKARDVTIASGDDVSGGELIVLSAPTAAGGAAGKGGALINVFSFGRLSR